MEDEFIEFTFLDILFIIGILIIWFNFVCWCIYMHLYILAGLFIGLILVFSYLLIMTIKYIKENNS